MPTYADLLQFYVNKMNQPVQESPPMMSYGDLQAFYQQHTGRPLTPMPPALPSAAIENVDAFLTEDEVVMKDEAKEAFAFVQESFANVGKE